MPTKRRRIPAQISKLYLPQDRINLIRDLARKAADAAASDDADEYSLIAGAANEQLGKVERGYFMAWRDAWLLTRAARHG